MIDTADKIHPFHQLLKPSIPFYWNDDLVDFFEESKLAIVDEIAKDIHILIQHGQHA